MSIRSAYYRAAASSLRSSASFIERQITSVDAEISAIKSTYDRGNLNGDANTLYLEKSGLVLTEMLRQQDLMHDSIAQIIVCANNAQAKAEYWEAVEARAAAAARRAAAAQRSNP